MVRGWAVLLRMEPSEVLSTLCMHFKVPTPLISPRLTKCLKLACQMLTQSCFLMKKILLLPYLGHGSSTPRAQVKVSLI